MPSDIIGTNIISEAPDGRRDFRFQPGPIFAQIVLADEINRATPKTQSALLEAMQEHSVTVGGTVHRLEEPFFVMATQNPIEQEGTYPLPEAQLDRFFFKLLVPFTTREELDRILDRTTRNESPQPEKVMDGGEITPVAGSWSARCWSPPPVQDYAIRLVLATHPQRRVRRRPTRTGSSAAGPAPAGRRRWCWPARCGRCWTAGTTSASRTSARSFLPALRHRVLLNFEAQAENISHATRCWPRSWTGVKEKEEGK